jgi:quinol monooxygenase YgiN
MSVTVVATIIPVPEHRAAVIAAFVDLIPKVHANHDGCELYALQEGADRLIMVEKWASRELLEAHSGAPEMADHRPKLEGKLVSAPEVLVLEPHPAGTAEQGTL